MSADEGAARPLAIVIGSGEVGSATAVVLHRAGCAVVVCDDVDPAWPRRGMAFTNAWYLGNAELDGEAAVFCASIRSIPTVLDRQRLIAATTWSWRSVAAALDAVAVVDATLGAGGTRQASRLQVCDELMRVVVVPTVGGDASSDTIVRSRSSPRSRQDGGLAIVRAERSGRFATARQIGNCVRAGEVLGAIGTLSVYAPQDGVLRGLSARGARIYEGAEVAEVDAHGDPVRCFGLSDDAVAVARDVLGALASGGFIAADAERGTREAVGIASSGELRCHLRLGTVIVL